MKPKAIKVMFACALLAGATSLRAEDNAISWAVDAGANFVPEVGISSGGVKQNVQFDPGFRIGVSGLYELQPAEPKAAGYGIGLDAAFLYNDVQDAKDSWLGQVPVLVKGVIFSDPARPVQALLGAGLGAAWTHFDANGATDNDFGVAWGADVTLRYALSDTAGVGLTGKYVGLGSPAYKMHGLILDADTIHNFSIGLVFNMKF